MNRLTNVLNGNNVSNQMKNISGFNDRTGNNLIDNKIAFNPTQRLNNQLKTANQIMNYAALKDVAMNGMSGERSTNLGYMDTLG